MDVVELPFPVDLAAPELMGSEVFELENGPVLVSRSDERCSSFVARKEKNHLVKQKNRINSKNGEKRNLKVPLKGKHDTLPVKAGSASFGTASGGSNFLGVYGLKSDSHDVTKLIDDFSLIGLLDGTYEAPNLGKISGKKEPVTGGTVLHLVRKARSALELRRPLPPQKFAKTIDLSSADKDPKPETPGDVLDYQLYQPKDILERLALPPPKDLNSLLQDADKPTVSSRNSLDARPYKQTACRPRLPAFPWSYNYSGKSRANADMIKLSSSKNSSHGRWRRIEKTASAVRISSCCFSDLDSIKYDVNLVPSERLKLCTSDHEIVQYLSGDLLWPHWSSSSPAPSEEGCPIILAAAQTLIGMAATVRQGRDGSNPWKKKASQKVSKARKPRPVEKGRDISSMTTLFSGSENVSTTVDQTLPSKKPKLSTTEKRKDLGHTSIRKGSVRSLPSKSSMMPPPARPSGKSYKCEHKMRNFLMEWQNGENYSNAQTKWATVLGQAWNGEKKRKARVNGERPRNSEIDSMVMNWHYGGRDSIAEPRHQGCNNSEI